MCLVELLLEAAVVGEKGEAVRLASVLAKRVVPRPLNPAAAREGERVAGQWERHASLGRMMAVGERSVGAVQRRGRKARCAWAWGEVCLGTSRGVPRGALARCGVAAPRAPESAVGVKLAGSMPVVSHRAVHVGSCVVHLSRPDACSLAGLHAVQRLHLRHPAAACRQEKSRKHAVHPDRRRFVVET